MNPTERAEKLELYGRGYELLKAALEEFPREMWQFKPSPRDWSIHEILVHIPDSEANSMGRFRAAIAQPGMRIMAYDQDVWAVALDYHAQDTEDAIEIMKYIRRMTYNVLKMQPDEVWSNTIDHPEGGIMSLDDLLDTYSAHIPGHIEQMRENYRIWKAQQEASV